VRGEISYEGQAAIELEAAAAREESGPHPFAIARGGETFEVDLRPTIVAINRELSAGVSVSGVASRFHSTLASIIVDACRVSRDETGAATVALSGGCFQNRMLTERAQALLEAEGFEVLMHRRVPPNDGGLSLGQAAVASFRRRRQEGG
jgi:hydrogenase maturation protein HypF